MSTHQFQMTYLRVFLSIQSNVSLFIQWITRSFTKAHSCSVTGLTQPDSVQNIAAILAVNKTNLLRNYLPGCYLLRHFDFSWISQHWKRSESRRLSAISTSSKLFSVYSTNGKRAVFVSKQPTSEARYQNRTELKVIPTTATRWLEAPVLSQQQGKVSLSQNRQL